MTEAALTQEIARATWRDYFELAKGRIVFMIVLTTAAGFGLGSTSPFDAAGFVATLIGTALVAAGTNAMNQYFEREHDAKMQRTRFRPLPDGRMTERAALTFSIGAALVGTSILLLTVHWLAAVVALTTLATYLFIYTPMKRTSTLCTLVGAVPGALPPVIGWTAARQELGLEAIALFILMFVWQLPHFMAIGFLYREDYGNAGFKMLAVEDEDGFFSARDAVLYSFALLPVSFLPTILGTTGVVYFVGAIVCGLALISSALKFARNRTKGNAKRLFLMSNLYLPLVMLLLVINRV